MRGTTAGMIYKEMQEQLNLMQREMTDAREGLRHYSGYLIALHDADMISAHEFSLLLTEFSRLLLEQPAVKRVPGGTFPPNICGISARDFI